MQTIFSLTYPQILRWASRAVLVVLLACMPWAPLSPSASSPSGWAVFLHLAGMAVIALLACTAFTTLWARAGAVVFVFAFSALMEWLQHFSPVRQGTWEDVGVNALGCLAGVLIFAAVHWLLDQ